MAISRLVFERIIAAGLASLASVVATTAATTTPTMDISQLSHAAWTSGDGFANGAIHNIAQTPDGYLWLATEFGLFRFDGVRTTPWPTDQPIDIEVPSLIAARDGTLWIGMTRGLASWKDGRLTRYDELSGRRVERAERVGGAFTLADAIPSGTVMTVTVPGRIAFRKH